MKIEFELTEAQGEALLENIEVSNLKGINPNEMCKKIVICSIVQGQQQLIADKLGG